MSGPQKLTAWLQREERQSGNRSVHTTHQEFLLRYPAENKIRAALMHNIEVTALQRLNPRFPSLTAEVERRPNRFGE